LEDAPSELRATHQTRAEISWPIVARNRRFPTGFFIPRLRKRRTPTPNNRIEVIDADMQLDFDSFSKQSR
jgi:hypothetical protein